MQKAPKNTDKFIITLAKQVDDNRRDIETVLRILSGVDEVEQNNPKQPDLLGVSNIQADFTTPATVNDRQFLLNLRNDIVKILETKGIKNFEMKFKK